MISEETAHDFESAAEGTSTAAALIARPAMSTRPDWLPESVVVRSVPGIIPADQLLFWTHTWRTADEAAEYDFAAGNVAAFENVDDAIRWLLSAEDD